MSKWEPPCPCLAFVQLVETFYLGMHKKPRHLSWIFDVHPSKYPQHFKLLWTIFPITCKSSHLSTKGWNFISIDHSQRFEKVSIKKIASSRFTGICSNACLYSASRGLSRGIQYFELLWWNIYNPDDYFIFSIVFVTPFTALMHSFHAWFIPVIKHNKFACMALSKSVFIHSISKQIITNVSPRICWLVLQLHARFPKSKPQWAWFVLWIAWS